jgi:hypothetical protein
MKFGSPLTSKSIANIKSYNRKRNVEETKKEEEKKNTWYSTEREL